MLMVYLVQLRQRYSILELDLVNSYFIKSIANSQYFDERLKIAMQEIEF